MQLTLLIQRKKEDVFINCQFISSIPIGGEKPQTVQSSFPSAAPSCPPPRSALIPETKLKTPAPSSAGSYQQPACPGPVCAGWLAKAVLQQQSRQARR